MNFGKPQSQGSTSNHGNVNYSSSGSFKYGRGGRPANNFVNYSSSTNFGNNSSGHQSSFGRGGSSTAFGEKTSNSGNSNSFGRGGSSNAFGEKTSNSSNSNSFGRGGSSTTFGGQASNSSNSNSFGRGGSSSAFGGKSNNAGNSFGRGVSSTAFGEKTSNSSNSNSSGRGGSSTAFRGQANNSSNSNSIGRGGSSTAFRGRENNAGNSFGRGGASTAFIGRARKEGHSEFVKIDITRGNKPDFDKPTSESINSSGFSQSPSNQIKGFDEPQTSKLDSLPRNSGFQPITTQQSNTSGVQPATMQQSNASADKLLLMESKIKALETKIGEMDKQLKGVLASHEIAQNRISDLTKTIEELVKIEKHRDSVQPEKVCNDQKLVSQDQLLDGQKSSDLNVSSGYESNLLLNQAEQGKQCSTKQAVQNSSLDSKEGQNVDLSRSIELENDKIDPREAKDKLAPESNIGQEKNVHTTPKTTAVEPKLPSYIQINDSHFVFEPVHFSKYHKKINERGENVEGKLEIKAHEDKCQITFTPSDAIKNSYEFWIPFDFVQLFPVQDHLNTLMIIGYDEQHTYDSLRTFFASFPEQSDSQAFKNLCYGQLPNDSSL